MTHWVHYSSKSRLGAKPKSWNPFIAVIAHKYLSNSGDSHLVLIWSRWVHIMQRIGIFWHSIRPSKVDSNNHVKLKTSPQIIYKGRLLKQSKLFKDNSPWFFYLRVGKSNDSIVCKLLRWDDRLADKLIFAVFFPVPDLQPRWTYHYLKLCFLGLMSRAAWISNGFQVGFRLSLTHSVRWT